MSDREGYLQRRDQLLMQDEEIAELEADKLVLMERDEKYCKTISGLQTENLELQAENAKLREAAVEAKDLLWKMQNVQPYSDEIHYVGALLNTELLKEKGG